MSYETARDLPSFKEMEAQLKAMKLMKFLLPANQRNTPREIEAKLNELAQLIDDFYETFGDRHWIFHEMLNIDQVRSIIDSSESPEDAEHGLIAMHSDPDFLRRVVTKCNGIPALRKRIPLVEKAREDYLAGRFYSTVLVLISVIDGFVNEFESIHRGAHSRAPEELSQYDSAISHHKGIESVQSIFLKRMSVTIEDPIHEVYRHGIMHGVAINFDNQIVAAKSWNLLLGFMDWATAKMKAEKPKEPQPTLRESLHRLSETRKSISLSEQFKPYINTPEKKDFQIDPVVELGAGFYDAWKSNNYGKMSELLATMNGSGREKQMPKLVRDEYKNYVLKSYKILSVDHYATGGSDLRVQVELKDGSKKEASIRCIYEDEAGEFANSLMDNGRWRILFWGITHYK